MKKILSFALLAACIFASYLPALRDGFVWDDTALVSRDPLIRSWRLIPEGFQHFLFTDATASDFYRPVQRLSYTLDYAAFGFRPRLYHLTSILCQIAAAFALFLFALELLRFWGIEERLRQPIAFLATLVWAIHPVHTAAVVYISGRADPLAAAFGFFGLYFGLRGLTRSGRARWLFTIAAAAMFLFSALSKETGLVFLILWFAIVALRKMWTQILRAAALAAFVAIVYLSLRLPAEHIPAPQLRPPAPLLVRPVIVARAFAEYAGLIIFPWNLHMDRDVETHPTGFGADSLSNASWRELQTVLGIILIAAAIYWLVRSRKENHAVFACLVLAAIAYLPISGIFTLNATIAEHWIYLPSAFLFLACGITISELAPKFAWAKRIAFAVLPFWILFLGARTFVRTFDWKDQRTFLERTIASGGDSARMFINLGGLDLNEGRLDSAKQDLQIALAKEPGQPLAILNLAAVAIKQSDFKSAHDLLDRATKMPLVEAQAHEMRAVLAMKETGQIELLRMRLAARTGAPNWAIEKRYVRVLDETGETGAAMTELKSCLRTEWYRAESWQFLSALLAKTGRTRDAKIASERANAYDVHLAEHPDIF